MAYLRHAPIRRKLMTMILVTSGVVMGLTCTGFVAYELRAYRDEAVKQLSTLGEIIAAESTGAVAFENQRDAREILGAVQAEGHIVRACLYDRQGRLFAQWPAAAPRGAFPAAPQGDGYRFENGNLVGFTPVIQVKGSERFGTLYLCSDMEAMYDRLRLYAGISLLVVVVTSLVAYLLARILQAQISRPIGTLAEAARDVSNNGNYAVRAQRHGDDELGELTDAFNHMLDRIQEQNELLEKRVQERTAELEAANDELEAFCSSAAHDLRTPLRAITGFTDVLLDPRSNATPADVQRYVKLIREGSGQMTELIQALLSFSRLGRQALTRQRVEVGEIARAAYDDLAGERQGRRVEFRLQSLPLAEADPALLRVVFVNLLSNALKYTRPRSVAELEVGVASGETGTVYFVRDNGVGFDMADADKLFGVFQRLHHAYEFEGTGVGLATVRRIVERHGGRIWAKSSAGQGATFYFTLAPAGDDTA